MRRCLYLAGLVLLTLLAFPHTASACEHCFGAAVDSMTTRGIAFSMAALLGFVGIVGTGVLTFFRRMSLRAQALEAGDLTVNEFGDLIDRGKDTSALN